MAKKSIKKNYLYNVSYQVLLLIVPFITMPYLSRVLGAGGIGTYSYMESIVSYFTLFATLGIATYGKREISYVQDDRKKRSKIFWNTKALEGITSLLCFLVYIVFAISQENAALYLVLSFNILAITTDIAWFFQGMEEFGKIVLRNFLFKILNIIYIFIFIRQREDLVLYLLGNAVFLFLSSVSLWFSISKYVDKPCIKELRPFSNIKVVLTLFIPTVAIQIYTVLDKTMIGIITHNSFENGYYEQAIRISKMLLTLVTALGTVMIPRIGFHFEHGENEKIRNYMYRAYRFVWFLGIPLCLGLVGISSNFVGWFYGKGFEKVIPLLKILSFLILAIGISNVTGTQFLIPTKRQNIFTGTVIIGAATNFVMNLVLIPRYQAIGAAIASVVAEVIIAVVQLIIVRKEFSMREVIRSSRNYLFAGMWMLLLLVCMEKRLESSILNTLMMVLAGSSVYFLILIITGDSFFKDNVNRIWSKIKKIGDYICK